MIPHDLLLFLFALVSYLIIDYFWLSLMKSFYVGEMAGTIRKKFLVFPGFLVYVLLAIGLVLFILPKEHAVWFGAFYGFLVYGTYNFTNLAILNGWTFRLAAVDIAWGVVLNTLVTVIVQTILR